jgi:hypothetical protein
VSECGLNVHKTEQRCGERAVQYRVRWCMGVWGGWTGFVLVSECGLTVYRTESGMERGLYSTVQGTVVNESGSGWTGRFW